MSVSSARSTALRTGRDHRREVVARAELERKQRRLLRLAGPALLEERLGEHGQQGRPGATLAGALEDAVALTEELLGPVGRPEEALQAGRNQSVVGERELVAELQKDRFRFCCGGERRRFVPRLREQEARPHRNARAQVAVVTRFLAIT